MSDFVSEMIVEVKKEEAPRAPVEQIGPYLLKRWTWYEKQTALAQATIITDIKRGLGQIQIQDFYVGALFVMVRDVPESLKEIWGKPENRLNYIKEKLDPDVGDLLRNGCMKLLNPDERSFLPLSEQKIPIPG